MDLQERAVIVAVQLKSSTYAKDWQAALSEALEITSEDNVIGGTEFLDPLIFILQNYLETSAQEAFKLLGRIFTGKNGKEFTNIFVSKIGSDFIIKTIIETADITDEIKEAIFIVIKHNKVQITEDLLHMNKHSALIEASLTGKDTIIEILVELGRDSNMFRKILIFNGFIEGLMKLSYGRSRALARCSIRSLAELMNSDVSVVSYFFEMRWKEWMEYVLQVHPEYALKIVYTFSEYPKYRLFLPALADTLFSIRDTASLFLLSYTETAHSPQLMEMVKSISVVCPCKQNFVLGIYSNIFKTLQQEKETKTFSEISVGTAEFFGVISNFSVLVDKSSITKFLASFAMLSFMPVNDALLFLKTVIAIALKESSSEIFLPDILLSLRELLHNDSLLKDIRILISFWLLLGYMYHRNKPSFLDSIFNNFHETVLPLALQFLTSLTSPTYNLQCKEGACTRCYFLQLITPDVIPHSISLLTQLLWVPSSLHSLILSKFALFLEYQQELQIPPAPVPAPVKEEHKDHPEPIKEAEKKEAPLFPVPETGIFDL